MRVFDCSIILLLPIIQCMCGLCLDFVHHFLILLAVIFFFDSDVAFRLLGIPYLVG